MRISAKHHPNTVRIRNSLAELHMGNLTEATPGPSLVTSHRTLPSKKSLARGHDKRSATAPVVTADDVDAADRARASLLAELELEELNTKTKNSKADLKKKKKGK